MRCSEPGHQALLPSTRPAGRVTVEQAAWLLNCQAHDVPVLVAKRLLKPLGNPPANGVKHFATALVLESSKDPAWLAKVTNAIHDCWRHKNGRKSQHNLPTPLAS